ncbi:MAG: TIGR03862 family flavoprotein [Sulfitobacter sp.]
MITASVIGSGPAGLMAAEVMARAGLQVTIYDAKPSAGRKFLMAGKSGLNLTKDEPFDVLMSHYSDGATALTPMIRGFDADAVQAWARGLDQDVFTGTTGRVFPKSMKASPLLRAWLARLEGLGVTLQTGWRWTGWDAGNLQFQTASGLQPVPNDVTVLALGGASWSRLGSDGRWVEILARHGISVQDFAPSNAGVRVAWSAHMARHFGQALKGIALRAGDFSSRGEAVISKHGLEGGGIYSVSRGVRLGHPLQLDLLPDMTVPEIAKRLARSQGKTSLANHLRKTLRLDAARIALAQECARPLPKGPAALAHCLKTLVVPNHGLAPLDEAISTAGGLPFSGLSEGLMLRALPGVFCAGEMLDWDAPTGGYLITACLATGAWAGRSAVDYAKSAVTS